MRLTLLHHNGSLFLALLIGCLILDIFLYRRHRASNDFIWKILGSNFFILYLGYRILLQWSLYSQYPQFFSIGSWVNWSLVMVVFLSYAVSYLIRLAPVAAASGWRETVFPLICAVLPITLYETESLGFSLFFERMPGDWNRFSIIFLIIGNAITIAGFISLGRSFSIMTEARAHVRAGLYRYVRHPIYLGESLATIGCCLQVTSWINIGITLLWLGLQRLRASFEEKKMEASFSSYYDYRQKTGAYFPKFKRL